MSGTASILRFRYLRRQGDQVIAADEGQPQASAISFSTDMRQFSGTFDFDARFGLGESPKVKSHDFVEIFFNTPSGTHQIGVGFIEDFVRETTAASSRLAGNGRDLIGQLINVPFKKPIFYSAQTLSSFVPQAVSRCYLEAYLKFRGRPILVDEGAYQGTMAIAATIQKRGAVLQEYADLGLNLVYQNRLGQVVLYGRGVPDGTQVTVPKPLGKLVKARGRSNVESIIVRQNFSKVFSESSMLWASGEGNIEKSQRVSPIIKNTDPRVAHIYQPHLQVYAASELSQLAGDAAPEQRMRQIGASTVRRSNQSLNEVIVTDTLPYFAASGIPYETGQIWHIESPEEDLDLPMKLAGIHYGQDDSNLNVQLAFVEPDTLI